MRLIPVLFCFAIQAFVWPASVYAADLTDAEIKSELVDHSIAWYENGGWHQGSLLLGHDGTAILTVDLPRAAKDTGTWTIENAQVCTKWGELRSSLRKCYSIQRQGDGKYVTSGGNIFEIREYGA